ncbi:hypothetical protein LTR78_007741 [Recurvomyces mirabilis]|uniref:Ribosomal protein eL8/eL30/eS12/Gadd45 domain-containing protein n=1 Tax=Recurvomyces mirabilis TaxID=574656 RepID=A0AAE0TSB8_9PEZI|nr:hypothetical protein LTR78_007741 [Recurvomyces mirabilis]KAK5151629.1 hypothetical protein LTS14_009116 [Recurvomyces mirabilis]
MAKDKTEDASLAKKEKKDKKDKKRKHSDIDPSSTTAVENDDVVETPAKKEKKEKKEKKRKSTGAAESEKAVAVVDEDGDVAIEDVKEEQDSEDKKKDVPLAALVPFANPLCGEKEQKKVLKGVKKAAKNKALKRGVKEVVKSIRKSPPANPATLTSAPTATTPLPHGIVILAADISPMDVISHIPVLCEDHNIPYLYVPSRAELGAAGATKRPTSVVMLGPKVGKGVEGPEAGKEWEEGFREVWKLAVKMGMEVKV